MTYWGLIMPTSDVAKYWAELFGSLRIPLQDPHPVRTDIGVCYRVQLSELTECQRAAIVADIARDLNTTPDLVESLLASKKYVVAIPAESIYMPGDSAHGA